ncbi:MAG: T9SS type A sorting domain-containing protein [Bacteroidetes bacterium]|nr:T9SS type A sorting domain-containing protein [Bacteroidota bacterium]MBK8876516.1 T9SS type A sorting domain-containing protein [Bacteroidota bacterium]MBK9046113.1 T9SS type A sorting domain-containing protein [Bacteroidota bacterium]
MSPVNAQKRGSVWCFGDSALIDFKDTANIITGTSIVKSRGSCASISDSTGNLLFYTSYDLSIQISGTDPIKVYGKNNQVILNGDSIQGGAWYRELVIVPDPASINLFYVFHIGVTQDFGLYYTTVDMAANSGQGAVIQKNVQLENFKAVDCLSAIKHGNGRDWWVFFRRYNNSPAAPNNDWYLYLITPSGVINQPIQMIGSIQSTGFGQISFNASGNRMAYINYKGLIELYDFNRCTGIISSPVTISSENSQAPWPENWSSEFSPSGNFLYMTQIAAFPPDSCYLIQFDLNSANIAQSADTIWVTPFEENMGQLKMALDGKMYLTTNYKGGYPYADTSYNYINMNLTRINSPDSLGTACNLQPFSFYLGGKRTYFGLPNNPDYDLPALAGSPCDTLVSQNELAGAAAIGSIHVYYHPAWEKAFINASNLKGKTGKLLVYDIQGKVVHSEPLRIQNGYYTRDLSMIGRADGVYLVVVETEQERLVKKILID